MTSEPVTTEAAAVARIAAQPVIHDLPSDEFGIPGKTLLLPPGWISEELPLEQYLAMPVRKRGRRDFQSGPSFGRYVAEHRGSGTTVYADPTTFGVVAVLDDHTPGGPADSFAGWCEHVAAYRPQPTPQWTFWKRRDRKAMSQAEFVQHIEDGMADVVEPDAADLYEAAQDFRATIEGGIKSIRRPRNGQVVFALDESVRQEAGITGASIELPAQMVLRLRVFDEGDPVDVTVRLSYELLRGSNPQVSFAYRIIRPDVVEREAFDSVLRGITEGSGVEPYIGKATIPETPTV